MNTAQPHDHDHDPHHPLADQRQQVRDLALRDETDCVAALLATPPLDAKQRARAQQRARALVAGARSRASERPLLDSFLQEFALSNEEGVALMCLAEGLLRIPDDETADHLIADKIAAGDWATHAGQSASAFVNASTWGLMLTGRLIEPPSLAREAPRTWLDGLIRRLGAPVVRAAFRQAMRIIGREFIAGRTIEEALRRSARDRALQLCSFDVLGEGARTLNDAKRNLDAYQRALAAIGSQRATASLHERSSLSIKLSALEPRYDQMHEQKVMQRLLPIVTDLMRRAAAAGVGFTIDAEEADRLDLSLSLFEQLARDEQTRAWGGLGIVVQAYGKRATAIIDWLACLARESGRRICVRLVKGAYWDAEIKRAQERGLPSYPVFTRKASTDLSYLTCAARLFQHNAVLYPQFATHNAHSITAVLEISPPGAEYEFQRLHGMGALLYDEARRQIGNFPQVRVYAPVGQHEELLSYLVRRLLENGANSSFVNRFMDERVAIEAVVVDPIAATAAAEPIGNPFIPLPGQLFGNARENSPGVDWGNPTQIAALLPAMRGDRSPPARTAAPSTLQEPDSAIAAPVCNPADREEVVGFVTMASADHIDAAFTRAAAAQRAWDQAGTEHRSRCLLDAADAIRSNRLELIELLVKEAGKTLPDAVAEVREAEDFCRYYAECAVSQFSAATQLPGPTGEDNLLSLRGRGVFACISPWNFPLAIFVGQVVAALVAGNAVVAKPAEATPLVASLAVQLLHDAGVPQDVLHFIPAHGREFGAAAFRHRALAGVAFTGSTVTARLIHQALAAREGPILPLIAETGGINAMIVDSSALLEQVVDDVLASAFLSAGQRCSALRILFVQENIAGRLIELIAGGMDELIVGDPSSPATDVGPIISSDAADKLRRYSDALAHQAKLLKQTTLSPHLKEGNYFAPRLFELTDAGQLTHEQFGPILHVVRYGGGQIDLVLDAIRAAGYGLTLGIHTRIDSVWRHIVAATAIGNVYVNRNMIGAVVGVQPFGGEGLSGTGPKAGGPHYLLRFTTERTLTVNTVATGGNARLLSLGG